MTDTFEQFYTTEDIKDRITELKRSIEDLLVEALVFPVSLRNEILFDEWSIQDVLGHLSAWNQLTIYTLTEHKLNQPLSFWLKDEDIDEFNAKQVTLRQEMSWEEVIAEFRDTSTQLLTTYATLSLDVWEKPFDHPDIQNATCSRSLDIDLEHFLDHLQQIREVTVKFRE